MPELILRTAVVLGADQSKKLYTVQLCNNPPDVRPAIPLGGLHTFINDTGTVNFVSYNVGDKVLVVSPEDLWDAHSRFCWICGLLPLEDYSGNSEDYAKFSTFSEELSNFSASLAPLRDDLLQIPDFLHGFDAREHSPSDLEPGDWAVNGEHTILTVGDHSVATKAGKSLILVDSVFNSITESSYFHNVYTLGERKRIRYYLGKLLLTKDLSGSFADSYRDNPIFRHQEQLSDVVHGYRRAVVTDNNTPIVLHTEELDGTVSTLSAGTVIIGRSCELPWYTLNSDSLLTTNGGDGIPPADNDETPLYHVNESDAWSKSQLRGTPGVVYETTFDIAGENEWEVQDTDDISTFTDPYTEEEIKVSNKKSGIMCLPDGTVLIRDGFGSEIRMCHGNVQISSANNLTLLGGRDILGIAPGMVAVNAGAGMDIGTADSDISICTQGALRIASTEYSLSAHESTVVVEGVATEKLNVQNTHVNTSLLVGKSTITTVSPSIIVTGEADLTLNTSSAALCIYSNSIIAGAATIDVHSNVRLSTGKLSLTGMMTSDYRTRDVIVAASSAVLTVGGDMFVNKHITANEGVQTAAGVYSKFFAAKDVPVTGVYGLKTAPEKAKLNDLKNEFSTSFLEHVRSLITVVKDYFTEKTLKLIKKVFSRESKACKIYNPPFSTNGSGRQGGVSVTVCREGSGELSYIYPGKRFWMTDGLVTEQKDRANMSVSRELEYSGVSSISVNVTNVVDNKED